MNNIIASPDSVLYDWDISKMLEVDFNGDEEAFPKIRETLTRIGIASRGSKTLTQTCNILQKGGRYYIIHYKEIFFLNGKPSTLTLGDVARRNRIANL
ncbi:MAG TPA: translational repressor RegA, partial [Methanosarcina sp.]|nr:translational repressor RegA [Methanosarcina sp.]